MEDTAVTAKGPAKQRGTNIIDDISNNEVDYDILLCSAGKFGRYQWFLFFSMCPFSVYLTFSYFSQMFMTEPAPNHWCWIPELANLTELERRNLAIPEDENARFGYSKCKAYIANWSAVVVSGLTPNKSWPIEKCQHGWEFNKTEIPYPTISSEWGWVCDKDSYQANAQSIFFVGSIVGGFLIGWVADRFGRIPAVVSANMIGFIAGVISVFARNFIEFSICRFFMGMSYDNCMMMMYLLVLEYVAPKYRTIIVNMPLAIFFTLALTMLPWIALACGHWKAISLATSIPMALSLLTPLLIPESPRWLLSKGRIEEAVYKVIHIGLVNKKEVPSKLVEQFKLSVSREKKVKNVNSTELLKRPLLRKIFICMCLVYMCCVIVYDALVRSIGSLGFDFFLSFSILSLTEFPSLVIVSFVLDLIGRKWLSIVAFIITSIFSVTTAFVGGGLPSVLCAVVARFSINMACTAAIQWGAEMLPTSVRGSGASIIHICGYVATVNSPYIVYLENFITWLPLVIVGAIAALGAVLSLALPETAGRDMPQTFEDGDELIKSQRLFDVPFLQRKKVVGAGYIKSSFQSN